MSKFKIGDYVRVKTREELLTLPDADANGNGVLFNNSYWADHMSPFYGKRAMVIADYPVYSGFPRYVLDISHDRVFPEFMLKADVDNTFKTVKDSMEFKKELL